MPKSKNIVSKRQRRRRPRATHRRRRIRNSRSFGQSMAVHRRLVLFPKVDDSKWLQNLAWFASVALKLFSFVTGVSDDLEASTANVGSGTTIILGPGDFAAFSPVSVPIATTKTDKEVTCLKAFPFERAQLRHVSVRIVPSVDIGDRGGMYAACLIPVDTMDSTLVGNFQAPQVINRYSCSYDDIIKNPRAKMAPVNRPLVLNLALNDPPANIRIHWDETLGFVNTYPNCALMVAFSDLAAKQSGVDSNYAPNKALFEVHMTGSVRFTEPGELTVQHNSSESSMSCYTPKLCCTNSKNINVSFFDRKFETPDGKLDLRKLNRSDAVRILKHYGRTDLIEVLDKFKEDHMDLSSFESLEM